MFRISKPWPGIMSVLCALALACAYGCGGNGSADTDTQPNDARQAEIADRIAVLNQEVAQLEAERATILDSPYHDETEAEREQAAAELASLAAQIDQLWIRKVEAEDRIDVLRPQRIYTDEFHGNPRTRVNRDISRQINEQRRELEAIETELASLRPIHDQCGVDDAARTAFRDALAACDAELAARRSELEKLRAEAEAL